MPIAAHHTEPHVQSQHESCWSGREVGPVQRGGAPHRALSRGGSAPDIQRPDRPGGEAPSANEHPGLVLSCRQARQATITPTCEPGRLPHQIPGPPGEERFHTLPGFQRRTPSRRASRSTDTSPDCSKLLWIAISRKL